MSDQHHAGGGATLGGLGGLRDHLLGFRGQYIPIDRKLDHERARLIGHRGAAEAGDRFLTAEVVAQAQAVAAKLMQAHQEVDLTVAQAVTRTYNIGCRLPIEGVGDEAFNTTEVAARLLVGLGEATLSPCVVSMIFDLFEPRRRGTVISLYLMGQGIASGLAMVITGLILGAVSRGLIEGMPILGGLAAWRATFVLCGLTGFVSAMLLPCKEPVRRGAPMERGTQGQ